MLDLGAGTGKLTRVLLAAGLEATALEPQTELQHGDWGIVVAITTTIPHPPPRAG